MNSAPDSTELAAELQRRIETFDGGKDLGDNMGESGPMLLALAFWLILSVAAWVALQILAARA